MSMIVLAALGLAALQPAASVPQPDFEDFVEAMVASGQFEGAVRIGTADGVTLDRAFGVADAETGRANTTETRFHIASIVKALTATLVLRAAERGELNLEDAITDWLPELDGSIYGEVRVGHLLRHTSGVVRDHTEALLPGQSGAGAMYEALNAVGLQSRPGVRYNYSNSGYMLLAIALERATGETYAALLQRDVLDPAGMTRTTVGAPEDRSHMAIGGDMPDIVTRVPVSVERFRGGLMGASGVFSTSGDLARFGRALEAGQLISPDSVDLMLAPIEAEGSDGDNAMGWMRVPLGETDTVWVATGASDGYLSMLLIDNMAPDLVATALQNNTRPGRVGSVALLRGILFHELLDSPQAASVPATPMADFLSTLQSDGPEAALALRDSFDFSDVPVASAAAFQALGEPDGGVGETAYAWAPATADAGEEWLELGFAPVSGARFLDVYFTQIPDALTRVRLDESGTVLLAASAVRRVSQDGAPVLRFALPDETSPPRVRLMLDTAQTPGWPQIDAVALINADGAEHWAVEARASTSAFMEGDVSIHDLPTGPILDKLAARLDENGHAGLAVRVRALPLE